MDRVNTKVKHPKAIWDLVAHRVFIEVCKEEVAAKNRSVQVLNEMGTTICQKFNDNTKRNYDKKQMKNRWKTLKKDYTIWKGLVLHASCLGRDPVTGTIDASDDWWAHEIHMCPEVAKFRLAPLQDEEDLKDFFDKTVVTNVHARLPPSSKDRAMVILDEDVEGSGHEREDASHVTPLCAPFIGQCYHVPEFQGAPPHNMMEKLNHRH